MTTATETTATEHAEDMAARPPVEDRVGVVLVHGIGAARPGEILAATTEALSSRAESALRFAPNTEVSRFEERRHQPRRGERGSYPCHVRRAESADGRSLVFGEVHWSDVKSIDGRSVTPLLLFLSSMLQAHRVINALLANRSDMFALALRPLLLWAAYLLRGPIVGLNLVLIIVLLAIKYCVIASQAFGWQMEGYYFVLGGFVFAIVVGLALISGRWLRASTFRDIGWAVLTLSVIGVALSVLSLDGKPLSRFNEFSYFSKGWVLLVGLWGVLSVLIAVAATLLAASLLTGLRRGGGRTNRAAVLALAILIFQSVIWATVIRVVWLTLASDLERTIDLGGLPMVEGDDAVRTLQITVLLNILILAAIFTTLMVVALARFGLARFLPRSRAQRLPRLMFSPLALNLALALGIGGFALSGALLLWRTALGETVRSVSPEMLDKAIDMALPVIEGRPIEFAASSLVVLSPALLFFFGRTLTASSQLLQDIIDYHPEIGMGSISRGGGRLSTRDRIADRFAQVVEHLLNQERVTRLVFVAHSQGTVITHDYLRAATDGSGTCEPLTRPVEVVTMGSPLNHIYAHYFEDYARFWQDLDQIGAGVRRWVNFFRVDDAIGTRLSFAPECVVEERALGPGGHANYWSEPPISDAILAAAEVSRPTEAAPPAAAG